jgi:predicted nucleic acid-binding protein
MTSLFVDTSAWYPLANGGHPDHRALSAALRERVHAGAQVITTNLIVAETHALLLRRNGRDVALSFARYIRQPPTSIVHSTAERETVALNDWIDRYQDQDFSLADAVSFTVMDELGIHEALTLDRHFAVAGFVPVPALVS